jgi:hypothetical protein
MVTVKNGNWTLGYLCLTCNTLGPGKRATICPTCASLNMKTLPIRHVFETKEGGWWAYDKITTYYEYKINGQIFESKRITE